MMNETRIEEAYARYRQAARAYADASETRLGAKNTLDSSVAQARYRGEIEGKNEAEREGHARIVYSDLYTDLENADAALFQARANLDIALREFEMCQALLGAFGAAHIAEAA